MLPCVVYVMDVALTAVIEGAAKYPLYPAIPAFSTKRASLTEQLAFGAAPKFVVVITAVVPADVPLAIRNTDSQEFPPLSLNSPALFMHFPVPDEIMRRSDACRVPPASIFGPPVFVSAPNTPHRPPDQ